MTMEGHIERRVYPLTASGYELLEEIGQGVSATVYRANCLSFKEVVAVKCLDLEKCVSNLDGIRREAQMMSLINHPNVVKAYCSFVSEQTLWVVMPFMAGGSCLHIMKSAYPDGFDEPVIASVLKAALKALEYLHRHGHIHRDVKAGNILVDLNGVIKLGDFGVSACMFDTGDRQRSRNTFVGTPCWMAPEVMDPIHGYDFKADIWSFGITGLELAHGHAPFSKYPPMKVLLMTLQNAPPGLDYERDKRFSKLFKEMIAMCLVKDPAKRPSAEKLLKHSFFKQAKTCDYVIRRVLEGLPSLGDRVKTLKLNDAVKLAEKKMPSGEWEERSQNEYKRGVSSWDFNVEDLKSQAAMIEDDGSAAAGAKQENDVSNAQAQHDRKEVNGNLSSRPRDPVGKRNAVASKVVVRDRAEENYTSNLGRVNEENDIAFKGRHRNEINVPKDHLDRIGSEEDVTPAADASSVKPKAAVHPLPVDIPDVDEYQSLPPSAALPPAGKGGNSSAVAATAAAASEGGGGAGAGAPRAPLRVTRSDSVANSESRRAQDVIGRSASLSRLNHHHRQVGRFNVYGSAVELSSANCIVDGVKGGSSEHDSADEQRQMGSSRRDDGGHVRAAAAGASSSSVALAADRDGGDERGQSHIERGSSEERGGGWSKPEFWERGSAGVADRSTSGKEGAAIVQKKGRFSITSEDVDTERALTTEKEREQCLLINELQFRIANLVNELHTMKSRNLELERQLREGGGGRVDHPQTK